MGKPDALQKLQCAIARGFSGYTVSHIRERRAAQHHGPLENERRSFRRDAHIARANAPLRRPKQAVAKTQEDAFSHTVGAEDNRRLARRDGQRDIVQNIDASRGKAGAIERERQAGGGCAHHAPANRSPARRAIQAAVFTRTTIASRTMPKPSASERSPFEVSSAIAVVMVRVKPSILPPTMMMAPTSAAARPKPASTTVTRLKRPSHNSVPTLFTGPDPSERNCSLYSAQRSSIT